MVREPRQRTAGGVPVALLDRTFVVLSRAADYSRLWLVVAVLLAALGGRRGRRAAGLGVLSLAAAASLANGPLKLAFGRSRPDLDRMPFRAVRRPRTSSFPSGHAAVAAAFATGVGAELPLLALPLGLIAAGVAYSRVHNRVHHRGDVVAGVGLGVGLALAVRWLAGRRRGPAPPGPSQGPGGG